MKRDKILMTLPFVFIGGTAFAQETERGWTEGLQAMDSSQLALLLMIMVALGVILLLLGLLIYLMSFISALLRQEHPEMADAPSWWEKFKERHVTGRLKPVEEEKDIMLDHSYDGIVELDNFMPPWLKYLFYGSIAFAVVYFVHYSVLGSGKTQLEEYETELELAAMAAEERKAMALASIDETNVALDQSDAMLQAGKTIYDNNCVACHASDGGGGVGPNFTDEYWLHGGSIQDVFSVIKYGVPEKGMIPWQDQLSPEEIQQVANYVISFEGTTSASPKEPQGEKYDRDAENDEEDAEAVIASE